MARRLPGLGAAASLEKYKQAGLALLRGGEGTEFDLMKAGHGETDLRNGFICVHVAPSEGPYELRLAGTREELRVSQFIYIVAGKQTQVFLQERSRNDLHDGLWATAKLSVHYAHPSEGFDPSSKDLLAAEELLNLIEAGKQPRLSASLRANFLDRNCPMLDLALWLSQATPWSAQQGWDPLAIQQLRNQLPNLPDALILAHAADLNDEGGAPSHSTMPQDSLSWPPMSGRAWDLALYEETCGTLHIAADSPLVCLAAKAVTVGPWLRFAESEHRASEAPGSNPTQESAAELGLAGSEFEAFVHSLRDRINDEMAARVQIGSTAFTPAERLFIELICPWADSTAARIMQQAGKKFKEGVPSEETIVRALRLPHAAIRQTLDAAVLKLFENTLLPTIETLRVFVNQESERRPHVRDALQRLNEHPSNLFHSGLQRALSLLSFLFLRYRGWPPFDSEPPGSERLASLLNGLDSPGRETGSFVPRTLRKQCVLQTAFCALFTRRRRRQWRWAFGSGSRSI